MGALRSVGLPGNRYLALAIGLVEVVLGAVALGVGGPIAAWGVALAYVGFAAFVAVALRTGGAVSSCGCFGTDDSPPTVTHLVLNLIAAVAAVWAAVGGVPGLPDVMAGQPVLGFPFLGFVALGTWFAYLALSVLPTLIPREATP